MFVFDLKNCVTYDGTAYAWDRLTETVVSFKMNSISTKDVPEDVLKILIAENREGVKNGE